MDPVPDDLPQSDPLAQLKALKASKPRAGDDPLEQLKAARDPNAALHAEFQRGDLAKRMASENAETMAEVPSYGTKVTGGIAALAKDIPGAEALQAAARSVIRRQPYRAARSDIIGAEEAAPAPVRQLNRLAGGTIAALATPGSPAMAGSRFGVAKGLADSDPNAGVKERLPLAVSGGLTGLVTGKLADVGTAALRGMMAKPLGESALMKRSDITLADTPAYMKAEAETVGVPATPKLAAALKEPDIKPYTDIVRASRDMQGHDEGRIALETYKQMGKAEQQLAKKESTGELNAADQLLQRNIGRAKAQLMHAIKDIAPSFPDAVAQHAKLMGERDALSTGADAIRRITNETSVAGKNLETKSPQAFLRDLQGMTPEERAAATTGATGRLGEVMNKAATWKPWYGFGVPHALGEASKAAPYLRATNAAQGTPHTFADLVRSLGISQAVP